MDQTLKGTGAEFITEALAREQVYLSFGIPGTHNIELYDALAAHEDMKPVLITDEQSSGFMADGAFRASGDLAALNLVPGAGMTHALSGIAECSMDQIPLLVILCGIRKDVTYSYQLHDIDQMAMIRPVCKATFEPKTHEELFFQMQQAARIARQGPGGPVAIEVPAELMFKSARITTTNHRLLPPQLGRGMDLQGVADIAKVLSKSKNIGIYAGLGCRLASQELQTLADRLDALVFTSISGKGVFDETHPRFVWNTMGRALPKPLAKFDQELDCLLAIGCRFGEVATASYGFTPPKTLIHVDIDSRVFHRNYPASHTLVADSRDFITTLLDDPNLGPQTTTPGKLADLAKAKRQWDSQYPKLTEATTILPKALYQSLQKVLGDDCVYVTDSGNGTFVAMEHLKLKKPHSFLAPVDFSCMGYSVPAAIGAKLAAGDRPVVATSGDGAILMTGLEMLTATSQNLGVIFCVLNDGKLSQIAQFQKNAMDQETLTALNSLNFEGLAKAVSMSYISVSKPQDLDQKIREAQKITQEGKPVILDVAIDYSISTAFTQGVLKTNFNRLAWKDRIRMGSRLIHRKLKH